MSNKRSRQNTKSSNNNASNNPSNNSSNRGKEFKIELLNSAQKLAWAAFQKHDVLFLIGPAGTGKTFLATAFAIKSLLSKECERIVLTRPIVEAGESLGFLPGDFEEKVNPYMMPMYDCIDKLIGYGENPQKTKIMERTEVAPLAYMRGRTFDDSVCVFDEAQNATISQLKLFMTRFGQHSKLIITGDPRQSDIGRGSGLAEVVHRLKGVVGIGVIEFQNNSIVRHPLIGEILNRLEDTNKEDM
jgi:phosphate starvation-inducible protein PhoH and related proteins